MLATNNSLSTRRIAAALSVFFVAGIITFLLKPVNERPSFYGKIVSAEAFSKDLSTTKGARDPKIELTLFCDYASSACRSLQPVMLEILDKYDEVSWTHKDYIFKGKSSRKAAEAARCAKKQNMFWDYHDILYHEQIEWPGINRHIEVFRDYADEIGLDVDEFTACMDFTNTRDEVSDDLREARNIGIYTAPALFINNTLMEHPYDLARIEQAVRYELRR